MQTWIYPAVFAAQDDGEVLVTFPDFPDAATDGRSMDEARAMAADLLEEALLGYLAHGRDVPTPSPVAKGNEGVPLAPIAVARAAVQVRMGTEKVSGVALAARMGKAPATEPLGGRRRPLRPRAATLAGPAAGLARDGM